MPRFTLNDLEFTTLSNETASRQRIVFDHIKTLNPKRDDEEPVSFAAWVFEHGYFQHPSTLYKPPHQIYLIWLVGTNQLLDLAGLVPDDRGVAMDEGLAKEDKYYLGFFGGHNVHPDFRGQGLGTFMLQRRIESAQGHANATGTPQALYTFFVNPTSGRNLERVGFKKLGNRYIKWSRKDEWLFRLQLDPQG